MLLLTKNQFKKKCLFDRKTGIRGTSGDGSFDGKGLDARGNFTGYFYF